MTEQEKKKKKSKIGWEWVVTILLLIGLLIPLYYVLNIKISSPEIAKKDIEKSDRITFDQGLSQFKPILQEFFKKQLSKDIVEKLENIKRLDHAVNLIFEDIDPKIATKINEFTSKSKFEILNSKWAGKHFSQLTTENKLSAIGSYLVLDKKFIYESNEPLGSEQIIANKNGKGFKVRNPGSIGDNPKPYVLSNLLESGGGNCATLPLAFTLLAESLSLPVKLVTINDHQFCRYDDGKIKINIEATNPRAMGVGQTDQSYINDFRPTQTMLMNSTTMKSQSLRESISSLYVTKSAYLKNSGRSKAEVLEAVSLSTFFDKRSIYAVHNLFIESGASKDESSSLLSNEIKKLGYLNGAMIPPPDTIQKVEEMVSQILADNSKSVKEIQQISRDLPNFKKELLLLKTKLNNMSTSYGRDLQSLRSKYTISADLNKAKIAYNNERNAKEQQLRKSALKLKQVFSKRTSDCSRLLNLIENNIKQVLEAKHLLKVDTGNRLMYILKLNKKQRQQILKMEAEGNSGSF